MNDIANNDEKKKGGPKGIHKNKVTVTTSYFDTKGSGVTYRGMGAPHPKS